MTSIVIPQNIKSIGKEAFKGCPLQNIVFPKGNYTIGSKAFNGTKSATLPTAENFALGQSLKKVEFIEGVTIIGKKLFYGYTSLAEIILPSTIKIIDEKAFFAGTSTSYNSYDRIVVCKAITPPTICSLESTYTNWSFDKNFKLYVPSQSIVSYYNSNWGDLASEIKSLEEYEQLKAKE